MRAFGNAKTRRLDSKTTLSVSRSDAFRHLCDDRHPSRRAAKTQPDTAALSSGGVWRGSSRVGRPLRKHPIATPDYESGAQSSRDSSAVSEAEPETPGAAFPSVAAGSQRCACDDSFTPDVVPDGRRLKTLDVTPVLHGSGLRWCSSHPMPHSEQERSGPKRCPEAVGRSVDSSRFKRPISPDFVDPKTLNPQYPQHPQSIRAISANRTGSVPRRAEFQEYSGSPGRAVKRCPKPHLVRARDHTGTTQLGDQ